MSKRIHLNPTFSMPLEAHTNTFAILAVRGAGKSNTGAVMAEEFFRCSLPFCVIDPVGSWWGLRSSADGKGAGLAIPIFGGRHGDVPLERAGGELIADLVVEKRVSCVLDLSEFGSEGDKKAFLLAFARRLYTKNQDPLHLFLEEADDFIPQKPMRDEAQLLRAWENIVRRGRARGLGMTLITQRSASINKNVLTQIETLIAMRTTSPQDRAAIEAWIKYQGQRDEILASLSTLKSGEAWVWSPHFLQQCVRVQIRRRATFDSGATPTNVAADKARPAAVMADIDLGAIRERMKETVERAAATDPKKLQARITELVRDKAKIEQQLGTMNLKAPDPAAIESAFAKGVAEGHRAARAEFAEMTESLKKLPEHISTLTRVNLQDSIGARIAEFEGTAVVAVPMSGGAKPWMLDTRGVETCKPRMAGLKAFPSKPATAPDRTGDSRTTRPQQAILDGLAWLEAIGLDRGKRTIVAFLADASPRSSAFVNNLGALRSAGLIEYPESGALCLTANGRAQAAAMDAPRTPDALHQMIYGKLPGPQTRILQALIRVYPQPLKREALADLAGASASSSAYVNNLGALRSLGLIDYPGSGLVVALPLLFLERGAGGAA